MASQADFTTPNQRQSEEAERQAIRPFVDTILAAPPLDPGSRLVFADWLEEQGDPRAEPIRVWVNAWPALKSAWFSGAENPATSALTSERGPVGRLAAAIKSLWRSNKGDAAEKTSTLRSRWPVGQLAAALNHCLVSERWPVQWSVIVGWSGDWTSERCKKAIENEVIFSELHALGSNFEVKSELEAAFSALSAVKSLATAMTGGGPIQLMFPADDEMQAMISQFTSRGFPIAASMAAAAEALARSAQAVTGNWLKQWSGPKTAETNRAAEQAALSAASMLPSSGQVSLQLATAAMRLYSCPEWASIDRSLTSQVES